MGERGVESMLTEVVSEDMVGLIACFRSWGWVYVRV